MSVAALDLCFPRGADTPVIFAFPGINLTGFEARLVIESPDSVTEWPLHVEWCDAAQAQTPASTAWTLIPRAFTAALPPGRQSAFELRLTEPRGTVRIAAAGAVTASGALS